MISSLDAAPTSNFDVFLCHNSVDKPAIRAIATQLQQHNISYWFDEDQLLPGCHWLDIWEQDMSQLKSVAVFVRGNGIGKWQRIKISICFATGCGTCPRLTSSRRCNDLLGC